MERDRTDDFRRWELEWHEYVLELEDLLYVAWNDTRRRGCSPEEFDELVASVRATHAFPFKAWWPNDRAS